MNFKRGETSNSCGWNSLTLRKDEIERNTFSSKKSVTNFIHSNKETPEEIDDFNKIKDYISPLVIRKKNVRSELLSLCSSKENSIRETYAEECLQYDRNSTSVTCSNNCNLNASSSQGNSTILEVNKDWGLKTDLSDILNANDGDKVWNFVRRGIFGEFKLSENKYGNICCSAVGKIFFKGFPDVSVIEINTGENMRKLLGLSRMQWSGLCDSVQEEHCNLRFNTFENFEPDKSSSLEKLWFFLCKRRHLLPNLSIRGKLSGAVKLTKEFNVVPKIVVTDIRDFSGREII